MKAPFFRVWTASGRQLADIFKSFDFEDSVSQDDELRLTAETKDVALVDDSDLVAGTVLFFEFGYIGGASSGVRQARISDIEASYQQTIVMTIVAVGGSLIMKKNGPQKVWKKVTASQVAEEIAKKMGLKTKITATSKVYESLPQAGKSDMEFLRYLAKQEDGGRFQCYVRDGTLYFQRRNFGAASVRGFVYAYAAGEVLSFAPRMRESTAGKALRGAKAKGINPLTKKPFTEDSEEPNQSLGSKRIRLDVNADELGRERDSNTPVLPAAGVDQRSDKAKATALATQQRDKSITATLELEGNPNLASDCIITMQGVARKHGGNWYVEKVRHSIQGGSAYRTTLELNKDASGKALSKATSPTTGQNTTQGAETGAQGTKPIPLDVNADRR